MTAERDTLMTDEQKHSGAVATVRLYKSAHKVSLMFAEFGCVISGDDVDFVIAMTELSEAITAFSVELMKQRQGSES